MNIEKLTKSLRTLIEFLDGLFIIGIAMAHIFYDMQFEHAVVLMLMFGMIGIVDIRNMLRNMDMSATITDIRDESE